MEPTFFIAGRVLQHSAAAVVLLALVALVDRRHRQVLMPAVTTFAWLIVASGALVGITFLWELVSLLSGKDLFSQGAFLNRAKGREAIEYWGEIISVVVVPQLFWLRRCRSNLWLAVLIGTIISAPPILQAAKTLDSTWPPAVRSGEDAWGNPLRQQANTRRDAPSTLAKHPPLQARIADPLDCAQPAALRRGSA